MSMNMKLQKKMFCIKIIPEYPVIYIYIYIYIYVIACSLFFAFISFFIGDDFYFSSNFPNCLFKNILC